MLGFGKKKEEKRERTYVNPMAVTECSLPFFGIQNAYSPLHLSAVHRCVDLISTSIANLPVKVLRSSNEGTNEVSSHPVILLFNDRNNVTMTKFTLVKLLVQSVLLKGNGFALIERAQNGTPISLRYIEAQDVIIVYDKVKDDLYYQIPFLNRNVEPKDMLHFKINSYDGVTGLSVLKNAFRSISIAQNTENSAKDFFANGMMLSGVLTVNGPLSAQQRKEIKEAWTQTYTNGTNGLAVLQGNMTYQPIANTAADSQMLESRRYGVEDICRFFGVSPVLLGIGKQTYNSLEMVQQDFLQNCLQGYITMMEEEMSRKLLTSQEMNLSVILETNEFLRTNKTSQSQYYSTLLSSGVLSVNEVRRELGYNGIGDEGDKHFVAYTDIAQNSIENNNQNVVEKENEND